MPFALNNNVLAYVSVQGAGPKKPIYIIGRVGASQLAQFFYLHHSFCQTPYHFIAELHVDVPTDAPGFFTFPLPSILPA